LGTDLRKRSKGLIQKKKGTHKSNGRDRKDADQSRGKNGKLLEAQKKDKKVGRKNGRTVDQLLGESPVRKTKKNRVQEKSGGRGGKRAEATKFKKALWRAQGTPTGGGKSMSFASHGKIGRKKGSDVQISKKRRGNRRKTMPRGSRVVHYGRGNKTIIVVDRKGTAEGEKEGNPTRPGLLQRGEGEGPKPNSGKKNKKGGEKGPTGGFTRTGEGQEIRSKKKNKHEERKAREKKKKVETWGKKKQESVLGRENH